MNNLPKDFKCITFDKKAQDSLPQHIKDRMNADRDKARNFPKASIGISFDDAREGAEKVTYCVMIGGIVKEQGTIEYLKSENLNQRQSILDSLSIRFPNSVILTED